MILHGKSKLLENPEHKHSQKILKIKISKYLYYLLYNPSSDDQMVDESSSAINVIAMKYETQIVMGPCEYEMIELFRKINLTRPIALTLACLAKGREISSQNIEMLAGLRQPEVSLAMRYLQTNKWIEYREEKKSKGKGRPIKMYRLTVPLNQIIGKLEEDIIAESRQVLNNIELLKKIPET